MSDFRPASRIILTDPYVVIASADLIKTSGASGIFMAYEQRRWRIDGDTVLRVLEIFDVPVSQYLKKESHRLEIVLEQTPACPEADDIYGDFGADMYAPEKIEGCIKGDRLLEMRLTYHVGTEMEFIERITHSGGFTVLWADEEAAEAISR